MNSNQKIWFPAKKYGWGWGMPCSWEGWVVFALYVILMSLGGFVFLEGNHPDLYFAYAVALSAVFTVVVWKKGEKPRWRWGDK